MDLTKIPDDFLDKSEFIFLGNIHERFKESKEIVRQHFKGNSKIEAAFDFITYGLLGESVKSEINAISRTWFFPSSEAEMELDNAINHCLIGSYKASYDHLRRGLELILANIYLTHMDTPESKATLWMESKGNTPYFSREVISNIIKYDRFKEANIELNWGDEIRGFYFKVCDIVHVNGTTMSFRKLNGTNFYLSGTSVPTVNKQTIIQFFNDFIEAMGQISFSLALYNPILLIDLPMTEKYGLNPPMSGFFDYGQSEILNKLIPDKYQEFCEKIRTSDSELLSVKNFIEELPDLTHEQFQKQIQDQQDFISSQTNSVDKK